MSEVNTDLNDEILLSKKQVLLFQRFLEAIYQKLGITEVLTILAEGIQENLKLKTVLISLYREKEKVFERKAHAGIPEDVFEELRKQKVPKDKISVLLKPRFKYSKSYYIPHIFFEKNSKLRGYIERFGKKIESDIHIEEGKWHENDVFITPVETSDGKFLGIVSVDNPVNVEFPTKKSVSLIENFSTYASLAIENIRFLKREKEILKRMGAIHNISKIIGQIFDLKTLYEETIHEIRKSFGYSNISIFEIDREGNPILKSYSGYEEVDLNEIAKDLRNTKLTGEVLKTFEPLIIPDVQKEPRYVGDKSKPKSEAIIPLVIKNKIVGLLDVEMEGRFSLGMEDLHTLTLLGEYIAMALNNAHLYRETRRLAIEDEMTGIYNYRYFREIMNQELKRRKETKDKLSLLMIDIDNFKKLNDTYGHIKGDEVLKKVSLIIKENARKNDIVTRYGGDEFVIILWNINKDDARVLGERIRKRVKKELKDFDFPLTLSIGISTYPEDGKKIGILLDKVDKALYRAKSKGKDRISV
jgi:diguanylate cyclase (GGDEF)-like protein